MEAGIRSVVRKTLGMLSGLVGIGAHICVCGGSSGGKAGRVCSRAASVCSVIVVWGMVGEDLRRANWFVGVGGSKIHVPGVGMSVATRDVVGSGVTLVAIWLIGGSRRVRWSHSPAE